MYEMVKVRKSVDKRNIVLRMETYSRLEKYLVELVKGIGSPRITFDDAVNALLDEHDKQKK